MKVILIFPLRKYFWKCNGTNSYRGMYFQKYYKLGWTEPRIRDLVYSLLQAWHSTHLGAGFFVDTSDFFLSPQFEYPTCVLFFSHHRMHNRKDQRMMSNLVKRCFTMSFRHSFPVTLNHDYSGRLKPEKGRLVGRKLSSKTREVLTCLTSEQCMINQYKC